MNNRQKKLNWIKLEKKNFDRQNLVHIAISFFFENGKPRKRRNKIIDYCITRCCFFFFVALVVIEVPREREKNVQRPPPLLWWQNFFFRKKLSREILLMKINEWVLNFSFIHSFIENWKFNELNFQFFFPSWLWCLWW